MISGLPAADVAPVRHGKIIETIKDGKMNRVFSCCGHDFTELTCWYMPKYCPNCGAPIADEAVENGAKKNGGNLQMNLNDTVKMMNSANYKERFKAEYWQTKIRYEKLHRMTVKYEAGTLDF